MSNATAVAPERATKATSRAKTKLAPAPVIAPAAPATRAITEDESLVVQTMAEQLQAIYDMHNEQMSINGSELLQAAADDLVSLPNCDSALYRAVAMVYGAIAVERAERPGSPAIAPLLVVHQSLRTASHGYGLEQDGCEAMAEGIRAGLRQFQERPTPPIRRADGPTDGQGPYNHAQLCAIITGIAEVALTLDRVLMSAQVTEDSWDKSVLIDTAQLFARQLGGMADSAVGGEIYGTHDVWNYGPNFAALGKAGAA
ncbi:MULTISPECIES: hypothetical protein [unclassified Acidovorax]|uniref:hypothetical protein n=1 Tax=unclassified Acidovorax TaxID=2684926 RepID=UPI001C490588|nr:MULTISPECIES: hypothetical protein [unclassified Acidovorax]MBV7460637.1 hypothetical protein [Acidovorax sp. sif0632]MBV7465662.1 hypothetical protein [Acidovorax sp. sif0613]